MAVGVTRAWEDTQYTLHAHILPTPIPLPSPPTCPHPGLDLHGPLGLCLPFLPEPTHPHTFVILGWFTFLPLPLWFLPFIVHLQSFTLLYTFSFLPHYTSHPPPPPPPPPLLPPHSTHTFPTHLACPPLTFYYGVTGSIGDDSPPPPGGQ